MRRARHVQALHEIAEVRRVQGLAAEGRLSSASAAVRQAEDRCSGQQARLEEDERLWSDALARPSLGLDEARAWSTEVLKSETLLHAARSDEHAARVEQERCRRELQDAHARTDAVRDLARTASRRLARFREEASLAEAADRFAARSVRS
jgi:hypothetical protein